MSSQIACVLFYHLLLLLLLSTVEREEIYSFCDCPLEGASIRETGSMVTPPANIQHQFQFGSWFTGGAECGEVVLIATGNKCVPLRGEMIPGLIA